MANPPPGNGYGYPLGPGDAPSYLTSPGGAPSYPTPPGGAHSYPTPPCSAPRYQAPPGGGPGYPAFPGGAPSYPVRPGGAPDYPVRPGGASGYTAGAYDQQTPLQGTGQQPPVGYENQPRSAGYGQPPVPVGYGQQPPSFGNHDTHAQSQPPLSQPAAAHPSVHFGTDEAALIEIIVQRSNAQRVEIRKRYKIMFGKDLMNDLKSELSGNLEDCLLALLEPSVLYDAKCLRRAMRGAGTDEETLIDVLATRSNTEISIIKQEYKNYYQRDLEKDCVSESSGHFKRLLVSMCQANRDETGTVNMQQSIREANDLFAAGEKKWGTDESRFNVVLASRNYHQLRATFHEYSKIASRDILESIEREMSGDLKAGFKCIVQMARHPASYFAERLWKSMKGAGTDDSLLIRIVVSRSEVDLADIKDEFLLRYHKTLYKMIQGDCSGDYSKLLLAVVGPN